MNASFLKCPDPKCNCLFLTQHDLDTHTTTYGAAHAINLKIIHAGLEKQYASSEWDEADAWQANTERRLKEAFKIYKQQEGHI